MGIKTGCTGDTSEALTQIITTFWALMDLLSLTIFSPSFPPSFSLLCAVSLLWWTRSAVLSHVVYSSVATGQIFPIFQQECFCQTHHVLWFTSVFERIIVSPLALMCFLWLNNKAELFKGLSVWNSRFWLHNQILTMRIFPLAQSWLFFSFHWPITLFCFGNIL